MLFEIANLALQDWYTDQCLLQHHPHYNRPLTLRLDTKAQWLKLLLIVGELLYTQINNIMICTWYVPYFPVYLVQNELVHGLKSFLNYKM